MIEFDREIDNQCLELYQSKELRNLELSSSASNLDLLKFPSPNVNSTVKKANIDAGNESRVNKLGSPQDSNNSSFSRYKHPTPQFRMYQHGTNSPNSRQPLKITN